MDRRVLVVVAVVALTLAGCASSGPKFAEMTALKTEATKPGTGRIYFYRTGVLGAAVQPDVRLNGEKVGKAVPQGFFFADRPPGSYEVSTSTEVERRLSFTLEANEVRYVRLNISMGVFVGRVYGELVDPAKGVAEIADTRYTGPPLNP